jgi:hypothetical protein
MADYYPLISRAVAALDKNSGENRRAIYERARNALLAQLRGVTPPRIGHHAHFGRITTTAGISASKPATLDLLRPSALVGQNELIA